MYTVVYKNREKIVFEAYTEEIKALKKINFILRRAPSANLLMLKNLKPEDIFRYKPNSKEPIIEIWERYSKEGYRYFPIILEHQDSSSLVARINSAFFQPDKPLKKISFYTKMNYNDMLAFKIMDHQGICQRLYTDLCLTIKKIVSYYRNNP